jgi:hypothetical protein
VSPRARLITASVLFSTGGTAIKAVSLDGWEVLAVRAAVASVTVFLLLPEARGGFEWRTVLVGCAYGATTTLFVLSNKLTTAANAVFLQNTSPLFILLLAPLVLRERISRGDLVFVGCSPWVCWRSSPASRARDSPGARPAARQHTLGVQRAHLGAHHRRVPLARRARTPDRLGRHRGDRARLRPGPAVRPPLGAARTTDWLLLAYLGTRAAGRGLPADRARPAPSRRSRPR